jgi:hypothetical protein
MIKVDQVTRRRILKTGLTAFDEEQTCPGYVIYSPINGYTANLIDLKGREKHRWNMPFEVRYSYLLPNGNLFYSGKNNDDTQDLFFRWRYFQDGMLIELDWDSQVVWMHRDVDQHHDAKRTSSGGAIYLNIEQVPSDLASKVKGGIPGSYDNGMWADVIVEVDHKWNRVWEWHAYEHLDPETDVLLPNVRRDEWTHGNTVVPLGDDRVMVSFRHLSMVAIIDKKSGDFLWRLGSDVLAQQHDPSMLPNGNVLIFDNGAYRANDPRTFTRVIDVNPKNNEIVWEYRDSPHIHFFSYHIGGAQRLSNGNTYIVDGAFGRMFQVTPEGEVVWEYINPYFTEKVSRFSNSVYRAYHYDVNEIPSGVQ